jgi:hypothetical protein
LDERHPPPGRGCLKQIGEKAEFHYRHASTRSLRPDELALVSARGVSCNRPLVRKATTEARVRPFRRNGVPSHFTHAVARVVDFDHAEYCPVSPNLTCEP